MYVFMYVCVYFGTHTHTHTHTHTRMCTGWMCTDWTFTHSAAAAEAILFVLIDCSTDR